MLTKPNPGLEMLMAGTNNAIGKITETWITEARELITKNDIPAYSKMTSAFLDTVKATTGITVEFHLLHADLGAMAAVHSASSMTGHSSVRFGTEAQTVGHYFKDIVKGKVDLNKGFVSGKLADLFNFRISISTGLFMNYLGFTPAETAALFLHELGHAFTVITSMGEYVYLNYYLTEGIEILQGKKANVYKIEVLDHKWLKDNIPKEDRDNFSNNPNEANIRRAILSAYKKTSRGYLADNGLISKRRDEQMADIYVTRLGYGRPLATALAKMHSMYPGGQGRGESTWVADTLRLMFMIVGAPITAYAIIFTNPLSRKDSDSRYDNNLERLLKIRRDLIQQIKILKPQTDVTNLVEDIDAIDTLTKAYTSNRNMFDEAVTLFRPSIRRMEQLSANEEKLESLVNNDLFLNAFKLQNL